VEVYEALEADNARLMECFAWVPDGMWRYVIIAFLVLFVWLVYPIAFIVVLVILYMWVTVG
jgi:hypothetical protein